MERELAMPSKELADAIIAEISQEVMSRCRIERLQRLRERKRRDPEYLSRDDYYLLRVLEFYHSLELHKIELRLEISSRKLSATQLADLTRRRGELRACVPDTPEWAEAWKNIRAREWAEKLDDWQSELDIKKDDDEREESHPRDSKKMRDDYFNKEYDRNEWVARYAEKQRLAWRIMHPGSYL